jgi:glycerophosphoryl diester phosphodiesterase
LSPPADPPDLDGPADAARIPWISASWSSQFRWNGRGAMPEAERGKLAAYVRKAHDHKRKVRFWGAPDTAAVWREQRDAGVDLINTDQLAKLRAFLTAEAPRAPGR